MRGDPNHPLPASPADHERGTSSCAAATDGQVSDRVLDQPAIQAPKCGQTDPHGIPVGRRGASRLRLSLPGWLTTVDKVHNCILVNLSRTGAQVAIFDSIREGEGAMLRCGSINQFVIVARGEFGLNGLEFDEPLNPDMVLELRRYNDSFPAAERRALLETARKWVTGINDDGSPI